MAQLSPEERRTLASNAAKERWRIARDKPSKAPGSMSEALERISAMERELAELKAILTGMA